LKAKVDSTIILFVQELKPGAVNTDFMRGPAPPYHGLLQQRRVLVLALPRVDQPPLLASAPAAEPYRRYSLQPDFKPLSPDTTEVFSWNTQVVSGRTA